MIRFFLVLLSFFWVENTCLAAPLPTDHSPSSGYAIDYSDLDEILSGSVLDMGPSTHKPPKQRKVKYTASRIQIGNMKHTRQEGNRVMFHAFGEPEKRYLMKLRDQLLAVPDSLPLSRLSRSQQLAYFLNVHTAIVLAEVAAEYPITYLDDLFDVDNTDAFINDRKFNISGTLVSLSDIQMHVVTNWADPLVIYGFYLGAVGTPNIRTDAYAPDRVFDQLRENAKDFVNSMRGTQIWSPGTLKVSQFYKRMHVAFPDFESDLLQHLHQFATPGFGVRIGYTRTIKATIQDWNIADLYNGRPFSDPGGRYPISVTDVEGLNIRTRLPEHAAQLLRDRQRKLLWMYRQRGGSVEIEEVPNEKDDSQ